MWFPTSASVICRKQLTSLILHGHANLRFLICSNQGTVTLVRYLEMNLKIMIGILFQNMFLVLIWIMQDRQLKITQPMVLMLEKMNQRYPLISTIYQ